MSALQILQCLSRIIGILFIVCYANQFIYVLVALWRKKRQKQQTSPATIRRYAVLISARNEETVIGQLLESIRAQDYPAEYLTTFVVADNCTDATAQAAQDAGAVVYERFDKRQVGKGYALNFLLGRIREDYSDSHFDGYFVFDADNLLAPDYVSRMNESFNEDCQILTSYRNSKNYGDNWISAGYGLWFIRDAAFLNEPRARLGISAVVAGTGFLFSREVMLRWGGWPFHSLSEDTEFTVNNILQGEKIGYCGDAEFFDEQPTCLIQSFRQRMRWVRGNAQVFWKQGGRLAVGLAGRNGLSCLDLLLSIPPAIVLTVLSVVISVPATVLELFGGGPILPLLLTSALSFAVPCLLVLAAGALTTATQWRHIKAPGWKKVAYTFTFPLFMVTYIPVTIMALFSKVEWKPIQHRAVISIQNLK